MKDGETLARFALVEGVSLDIGRDPVNDIVLAHPTVSSRHAALRCRDGAAEAADRGSRFGTLLDDTRISDWAPLRPDSRLWIGEVEVVWRVVDDETLASVLLSRIEAAPKAAANSAAPADGSGPVASGHSDALPAVGTPLTATAAPRRTDLLRLAGIVVGLVGLAVAAALAVAALR